MKFYLFNHNGYNAPKDKDLFPKEAIWDNDEKLYTVENIELKDLITQLNGDRFPGSNILMTNFKDGFLITFSYDGRFPQR
jgi:hypothetical protein